MLAPGVFDLISAGRGPGFPRLYVTGYRTVASYVGLPDAGIPTYHDMLEHVAQIVKMTDAPVSPTPIPAMRPAGCPARRPRWP